MWTRSSLRPRPAGAPEASSSARPASRLPRASASLGQPRPISRVRRWHPGHIRLAFDIEAYPAAEKRTRGGPGESCELGEPPKPSWEGEPLLASGEGGMKLVRAPGEGEGEGWGWG
jgi:hypothetical protein